MEWREKNCTSKFYLTFQPTHYVTITTRRDSADSTDCADVERVHLKKLVGQLKNNLCSVSVLSEPDLELLSNMDPNSLADITGKDFIEQLKEASGRLGGGTGWSGDPPHLDSLNVFLYITPTCIPALATKTPTNPTHQHANRIVIWFVWVDQKLLWI